MLPETVQRILLIVYGASTLLLVFPLCVATDLIPVRPLEGLWCELLWLVILYLPHQVCAYLHMRKDFRVVSFQKARLIIDLIAVVGYASMATHMGENAVFVAWYIVYIVLQRAVELLWIFRKSSKL